MREQENGQVQDPVVDGIVDGLIPADAAALDALIESGLDVGAAVVWASVDEARVRRVSSLLELLEPRAVVDPSLADVTLARVLRAGGVGAIKSGEPALTSDDEVALEAWVSGGFDAGRAPASLRERARKHEALAALVTTGPALSGLDALAERTLARVQAEIDLREESLDFVASRRRPGIRLADLVSVAAVLLIGCGVILPVLSSMREQSRRAICNANMGNTALAMSTYAGSNRDSMPVAMASLGGGKWWDVGVPSAPSNSANLYTLARDGYIPLANLACPGNPSAPTAPAGPDAHDWRRLEEVSYSYQIMFGPRPEWNGPNRMPVLADRSPVILRAIRGEFIDPFANAPNHRGAGQHLLYNDGTVSWAKSPVLESGDNIWLPRAIEVVIQQTLAGRSRLPNPLQGTELPGGADDACLGP
jgi:hypothetical protein